MENTSITIDLEPYSDGLEVHTIDKIFVNDREFKVTEFYFLGELSDIFDGYHYQILEKTKLRIFPVDQNDTIQIPVIFKTPKAGDLLTEIPAVLDEYLDEITSGVIAQVRTMPDYQNDDVMYHASNYESGISKAKARWFKHNTGRRMKGTRFV